MLQRVLMAFLMIFSFSCIANDAVKEAKPTQKSKPKEVFVEGKHYKKLAAPLPVGQASVVEFFYYGCRSCYQLVPQVANWSYTNKIDVMLVPAHSDTTMLDEARMFHTFEYMGVLDKMYELGYVMFQTESNDLQGVERVNSFLDRHKVDKDKFWAIWKSDLISQRLKASGQLTKHAQISKTPTFVVHGIYKVDVESLKSVEELFELLNYLMAKKPETAPLLLQKSA